MAEAIPLSDNLPPMNSDPETAGESRPQEEGERETVAFFPPELWSEILFRLPVRSLFMLQCVSKFFLSVIQSPSFRPHHYSIYNSRHSDTKDSYLFFLENLSESEFGLCRGNTSKKTLEYRVLKDKYGGVARYVDGLFWLHRFQYSADHSVLCNAQYQECVLIAASPSAMEIGPKDAGFGYDPLSRDYKIVMLRLPIPIADPFYLNNRDRAKTHISVEIYSLKLGSWKCIDDVYLSFQLAMRRNIYANGAIHWMARHHESRPHHYTHIVSFDLSKEVFIYRELPEADDSIVKLPLCLHGLFAVFYVSASNICVWVLEENGWIEEFTIESSFGFHQFLTKCRRSYLNNAVFSEKTDELLIAADEGLITYNLKTQYYKTSHKGVSRVGVYMENLLWKELLPITDTTAIRKKQLGW